MIVNEVIQLGVDLKKVKITYNCGLVFFPSGNAVLLKASNNANDEFEYSFLDDLHQDVQN